MDATTTTHSDSIDEMIGRVERDEIVLPEFQRDFVWDEAQTYDLFDSLIKDIFIGSLIYGIPSFDVTVRELDTRPRKGKGSRKKLKTTNYTASKIKKLTQSKGFRLLLDGQQRTTALYRALHGMDDVWIQFLNEDEVESHVSKQPMQERSLEDMLYTVAGKESADRISIKISDIFTFLRKNLREIQKAEIFSESEFGQSLAHSAPDEVMRSDEFATYLILADNLRDLLKSEKLLSYYLLDTNEEKFALFFERSNSKGVQLNFIDILAAKVYAGFRLREEIENFNDENPNLKLDRDAIVRAVSIVASKGRDVGRKYILSNLTHEDFSTHWSKLCDLYRQSYEHLIDNRFIVSKEWMPYDSMIVPIMVFLRALPHQDFSQMTTDQKDFFKYWFWSSVFAQRYSVAAGNIMVEDSNVLHRAAGGDFSGADKYFRKFVYVFEDSDDLLNPYRKYSALYKGILNFTNQSSSGGLRDWGNDNAISASSKPEDHHIFPREYLRSLPEHYESRMTDSVMNRALVPKITNIKIGSRPPSEYLASLAKKNSNLCASLESHAIPKPQMLLDGDYDDVYPIFLDERAAAIKHRIDTEITPLRDRFRDSG